MHPRFLAACVAAWPPLFFSTAAWGEPDARDSVVYVQNRPVVEFRQSLLGFTPQERAEQASGRVDSLVARAAAGLVTTQPTPNGTLVSIDGVAAFVIAPLDVDAQRGATLDAVSDRVVADLRKGIEESRELRDATRLTRATLLTVALAGLYVCVLWALRALRGFGGQRLLHGLKGSTGASIDAAPSSGVSAVGWIADAIASIAFWALAALVTYEWIGQSMLLWPITRPWGEQLNARMGAVTLLLLGDAVRALPNLLITGCILLCARLAVRLLRPYFDRIQARAVGTGWLDAETVRPTRRLTTIAIWLLALVMAYPYMPGSNTDAFKGLSVLVGLMVSIGGASVVGQALSGLILTYARSFRVGEYIRVGEYEGVVVELGVYQTCIHTGLGEELRLPNSLVLATATKNYSRRTAGPGYLLDTSVTIGYDTPWRQVHALLKSGAACTPGVLSSPQPQVFQTALSDYYVEYRLTMQVAPLDGHTHAVVLGLLHQNILDAFNENGVQIMSPHYIADPQSLKVVSKDHWFDPPADRPAG